jgi:hypothetical protein
VEKELTTRMDKEPSTRVEKELTTRMDKEPSTRVEKEPTTRADKEPTTKVDKESTPFFCEELLFSQERDRQPIVKFYRQSDTVHISRLIPRNKHFHVVCMRENKKKSPEKATDWSGSKMAVYPSKPCVLGINR